MSEVKLCECGCGQLVKNRFVKWHSSRIVNMRQCPWSKNRLLELRTQGFLVGDLLIDAERLTGKRPARETLYRWLKEYEIQWLPSHVARKISLSRDLEKKQRCTELMKANALYAQQFCHTSRQRAALKKSALKSAKVRSSRARKDIGCGWCAKIFRKQISRMRGRDVAYCCRSCAGKASSAKQQKSILINIEKMKRLRIKQGLSQQVIADKVGISRTMYKHYESYRWHPSKATAEKLIAVLGDSVRPNLYEPPEWANQLTTQGGPDGSNEAAGAREER